jgi:hypothetical protein
MSEKPQRTCCMCGEKIAGTYARYCERCRAKARRKPLKYVFTPRIDDAIRDIYITHPQAKMRPGVSAQAARLRWPRGIWYSARRSWSHKVLYLNSNLDSLVLDPYLILEPCTLCHRPELLLLDKFSDKKITYLGNESGHKPAYANAAKLPLAMRDSAVNQP